MGLVGKAIRENARTNLILNNVCFFSLSHITLGILWPCLLSPTQPQSSFRWTDVATPQSSASLIPHSICSPKLKFFQFWLTLFKSTIIKRGIYTLKRFQILRWETWFYSWPWSCSTPLPPLPFGVSHLFYWFQNNCPNHCTKYGTFLVILVAFLLKS